MLQISKFRSFYSWVAPTVYTYHVFFIRSSADGYRGCFRTLKVVCLAAQSWPTLCDPVDCGPAALLSMGILQARTLECVAISFSRGSSRPRDRTQVFHTLVIINNATMNTGVHASFQGSAAAFLRHTQEWDCWIVQWLYFQLFWEPSILFPKVSLFTFPIHSLFFLYSFFFLYIQLILVSNNL